MRYIICTFFLSLIIGLPRVWSGDNITSSDLVESIRQAKSLSECFKVGNDFYKQRNELQRKLYEYLNSEDVSNEQKCCTVFMLGEMSVRGTSYLLVNHIDLVCEGLRGKTMFEPPLWSEFPVQQALVKLGKQSIPVVIAKLKTEQNKTKIELLCGVILGVEGKKIGQIILQDAIDAEKDPDKKKRLENALAYFDDQTKQANQPSASTNTKLNTPSVSAIPTSKTAGEKLGATTIVLVVVAFLLLVDILLRLRKSKKVVS